MKNARQRLCALDDPMPGVAGAVASLAGCESGRSSILSIVRGGVRVPGIQPERLVALAAAHEVDQVIHACTHTYTETTT